MTVICLENEGAVMRGEMHIPRGDKASSLLGMVVRFRDDPGRREFTISRAQTTRKPFLRGDKRVEFVAELSA